MPSKFISPALRFLQRRQGTAYDWHRPIPSFRPDARHATASPAPRSVSQITCLSSEQLPSITEQGAAAKSASACAPRAGPSPAGLPRAPPPAWPRWGAPPPALSAVLGNDSKASSSPDCEAQAAASPPTKRRPSSAAPLAPFVSTSSLSSAQYTPLADANKPWTVSKARQLDVATSRGPQPPYVCEPTQFRRPQTAAPVRHHAPPQWWGHAGTKSVLDSVSSDRPLVGNPKRDFTPPAGVSRAQHY